MGILYIVATPIGNMEDISFRAVKVLRSVDLILCEDTRRTGLLLNHLNIKAKLLPYYDEIENKRIPEVIQLLEEGKTVAIVSDAGTPLISDPGFRLVRECIKRGIRVESIPGPTAFIAALTSSGQPTDKFLFLGYPPEKQSQRLKLFSHLYPCTTVFYCAPHKLNRTLIDLKSVLGDIDITIAREITKIHEEIWRGKIADAITTFDNPQGEFVLILNILQA